MADLKASFEAAVANSKNLSERPDNATLLKIYALYKQATAGDNTEKKPGFGDMVGRAKWDAWNTRGIPTKSGNIALGSISPQGARTGNPRSASAQLRIFRRLHAVRPEPAAIADARPST
jgi:diazepam-binding inhibitor (GABA receptor modulating acyl-CoA-binding protein)